MAGEIIVHLSNGAKLTVSKDREHDLRTAMEKRGASVTVRAASSEHILNADHIVQVEIKH